MYIYVVHVHVVYSIFVVYIAEERHDRSARGEYAVRPERREARPGLGDSKDTV